MDNEQVVIEEELIIATGEAAVNPEGLEKGEAAIMKEWEDYYKAHDLEKASAKEVWQIWNNFCKEKGLPFQEPPDQSKMDKIKEMLVSLAGEGKEDMSKSLVDQINSVFDETDEIEKAGRKVSEARLSKLRKLMTELMQIVAEVEPQAAEKSNDNEQVNELTKQLSEVEKRMTGLMKSLGVEEVRENKKEENPTVVQVLQELTKRLDAIESIPAVKTSIDGQEELPETKTKKTLWKGLI